MSGIQPARKKKDIEKMFNSIASGYDLTNTLLSLGTDRIWRKRLVKELRPLKPVVIADIATGTGKLAGLMAKKLNAEVHGIDISEKMLEIAKNKFPKLNFIKADGESIPFPDMHFDALTISFGIRNFENPVTGLREALRVIKPNGTIAILEFSQPSNNLWGKLFKFYFRKFIPFAGKILTGNKNAYTYLNKTALSFTSGNAFIELLKECGFINATQIRLSGGIATIYLAHKQK